MTDSAALKFSQNKDSLLQDNLSQIMPAHINMAGAFSAAANNNSIGAIDIEPQKPQTAVEISADRIHLMNTACAYNDILQNPPQGMKMPAKGEINELSQGVSGVALEAASALFGSVFSPKQETFDDFENDIQRKLAMNMAPRPTGMFGMG